MNHHKSFSISEKTGTIAEYGIRKRRDGRSRTDHVEFDSKKCVACWECVGACPKSVFGKINIIIHKHARIVNPDDCTGCRKCVKACTAGAIIPITGNHSMSLS